MLGILLVSGFAFAGYDYKDEDVTLRQGIDAATPRSLFGTSFAVCSNNPAAYTPGIYGKHKITPMFISYREWDGEIRLAGIFKYNSVPWVDQNEKFNIEVEIGGSYPQRLLVNPSNIVVNTTYKGTIQIGTNFFTINELKK